MGLDLFKKYDNLPDNYVPDNEWRFAAEPEYDTLVPGQTSIHSCELPFWFSDYCSGVEATITQGTELRAHLVYGEDSNITIEEVVDIWDNKKSFINITLNPNITSTFNYYNQDCYLQLKLILKNGSISYENKVWLKIVPTLDHMIKKGE